MSRHNLPAIILLLSGSRIFAVDFAHDVVPILKQHCAECHGGTESKGGFSINSRDLILDAEAATPRNSSESIMMERIRSTDVDLQMPPPEKPRLSPKEEAILAAWSDEGLNWEAGFTFAVASYTPPLRPRRPELPEPLDGRDHPIDRIVDSYMQVNNVERPGSISDAAFQRRVHLDVVGLLPTPEDLLDFERSGTSRQQLVETLLANDVAYTEHWLSFWNDLLRNDYAGTGFITKGRFQISKWLYDALLSNKPYDEFARDLLTPAEGAEGFIRGIRWRGTVNASQRQELQFAQNVSQTFLGINLKCASCHDSFINHWTLEETYAFAQIYATEELKLHRCDKPTGQTAKASWLFPELGQIDPNAEQTVRLAQLGDLLTDRDNGRFTRTIVNRIWHRLMGRGIVHPVDAMHTEPWSEDLIDYLAVRFVDDGYDLKKLIAFICSSEAYQSHSPSRPQFESGKYVFTGPLPRRMTAEQFVDTVWQLTGSAPAKFDAPVTRIAANQKTTNKEQQLPVAGKWIWSQDGVPPGNEVIRFRKTFHLDDIPSRAIGIITCDNEYILSVNGHRVGADTDWLTAEAFDFQQWLKAGENEILIEAKNITDQPNPAALFFEAKLTSADGELRQFGTSVDWEWSKASVQSVNENETNVAWKPAVLSPNPGIWDPKIRPQVQQLLATGKPKTLMVRASLLKADELMRALGRPNRDQIVTMRPEGLTTLEAIQLANGQRLADAIAGGAKRATAQFESSDVNFVDWLFRFALARQPTDAEQTQAEKLLASNPGALGVEDLLWAVLMLPEYQLVR